VTVTVPLAHGRGVVTEGTRRNNIFNCFGAFAEYVASVRQGDSHGHVLAFDVGWLFGL